MTSRCVGFGGVEIQSRWRRRICMVNPVHLPKIIPRPQSSAELHIGSKGVNWSMNLTFRCVKCKYPHHFESDDLQGRASVSFSLYRLRDTSRSGTFVQNGRSWRG
jgi:hypothetical protein